MIDNSGAGSSETEETGDVVFVSGSPRVGRSGTGKVEEGVC